MAISEKQAKDAIRRLHLANSRLLKRHPFYAVLLLQMKYALDEKCETAYTDGERIAFSPAFMDELNDKELDFVLMHEVLHVALEHCSRTKPDYNPEIFNIACDIVVNSNILHSNNNDISSITLRDGGVSMHELPDGDEGYRHCVEEVYEILLKNAKKKKVSTSSNSKEGKSAKPKGNSSSRGQDSSNGVKEESDKTKGNGLNDDHSKWPSGADGASEDDLKDMREKWNTRVLNAEQAVKANSKSGSSYGMIPMGIKIMLDQMRNPQLDWRTILNCFIQEEVNDYSFMPPDRRNSESDIFLPDFNQKSEKVEKILFMIDTSGSMSKGAISSCYWEIKGAIDQFDGALSGYLGFFDAKVVPPIAFSDVEEFKVIHPEGGGGTSFEVIFDYVRNSMGEDRPASIIIMTDGYAPFPDESAAMDIPVLWVVTTDCKIPWGKIARIKED